jgi:hypothetical protein
MPLRKQLAVSFWVWDFTVGTHLGAISAPGHKRHLGPRQPLPIRINGHHQTDAVVPVGRSGNTPPASQTDGR